MDKRPIGVFDSGLGGLTAFRELMVRLPQERLIYFGDTGRVPYGGRSRQTILKYARQDVAFLQRFHPKAIVIACGTVSTTALETLQEIHEIPIFGVVEPACRAAVQMTRNGRVGLIGTQASIRTGAYERTLSALQPGTEVVAVACPLLVPLVENGRYRRGDAVVEMVVREYLEPFKQANVDTLILGCTHYPLLSQVIEDYLGPDVALVDVGAQCANQAADWLLKNNLLNEANAPGERRYFVSDDTGDFARMASIFLGENVSHQVEQIEIADVDL